MAESKSKHTIVISAIDNASTVITKMEGTFKRVDGVIGKMFAVTGVAAIAALTTAIHKSVKAASEEESVMRRLQTAVEKAGESYGGVESRVNALLKSQERLTAFADDQTATALSKLVTITGDLEISMQAVTLAEDIASTGIMDLDASATALGKALTGNTAILQRYGIQIEKGASQTDLLASMTDKFGGAAQENVKSFAGRLQQLRNEVSNVMEVFGGPFLAKIQPVIVALRDKLASAETQEKIKAFAESIAQFLPKAVDALIGFADFVTRNGDTILAFLKGMIAIRIASWATNAALGIGSVVTALAAWPTWARGLLAVGAGAGASFSVLKSQGAFGDDWSVGQSPLPRKFGENGRIQYDFPLVGSGLGGPVPLTEAQLSIYTRGEDAIRKLGDAVADYSDIIEHYNIPTMASMNEKIKEMTLLLGSSDAVVRASAIEGLKQLNEQMEKYLSIVNRGFGKVAGLTGSDTSDRMRAGLSAGPRIRQGILPTVTRDEQMTDEQTGYEQWLESFTQKLQSYAMTFNYLMSSVTQAIVQGAISGSLTIKTVFQALRNAVLQLLADLAARAASAWFLTLLFPALSFKSAFSFASGGGWGLQSAPRVSPAQFSGNGNGRTMGGGTRVVFNGPVYGSPDAIAAHIEDVLARRMKSGQSALIR